MNDNVFFYITYYFSVLLFDVARMKNKHFAHIDKHPFLSIFFDYFSFSVGEFVK